MHQSQRVMNGAMILCKPAWIMRWIRLTRSGWGLSEASSSDLMSLPAGMDSPDDVASLGGSPRWSHDAEVRRSFSHPPIVFRARP
jgi:hypothetical protein